MRILYVITKGRWGGAQRYVFDLATHFKDKHEVAVALGTGELEQRLTQSGVAVFSVTSMDRDIRLISDLKSFIQLAKIIHSFKPDVVHLNSAKASGLGALLSRVLGVKKIIVTSHGWAFNEQRPWFQKKIILFLQWMTILLSHKVINVSKKTAEDVSFLPMISHNKITVIYNGVQQIYLQSKEQARSHLIEENQKLRSSLPKKIKKPIWIGTFSELHTNKGLFYILEALKELKQSDCPPFVFIIIGEGDLRESIEHYLEKNNLQSDVFLMGHVVNAREYLKSLDIFTLTSITEALPYSILEAGSAEVAVLASIVGGIPEIINQLHDGLLIKPRHVKEIKDGLLFLIKNEVRRAEMASSLRQKIENQFSSEVMFSKTEELYKSTY